MLVERVREREVVSRIKVSDAEIDDADREAPRRGGAAPQLNIAQILVTVPEGAAEASSPSGASRAEAALRRVRAGEDFADRRARGFRRRQPRPRRRDRHAAARPAARPVRSARCEALKPGEVAPELLRSGAGFHVLKLVERKDERRIHASQQSRARHILLRPSAQLTAEAAARRLAEFKREILAGARTFEQLRPRELGGRQRAAGRRPRLGRAGILRPGVRGSRRPAAVGGISDPVTTRFGVHLIQVVDRRQTTLDNRQLREQARNILREQKFEAAYAEWLRDLRGRAYIEMREPPQ